MKIRTLVQPFVIIIQHFNCFWDTVMYMRFTSPTYDHVRIVKMNQSHCGMYPFTTVYYAQLLHESQLKQFPIPKLFHPALRRVSTQSLFFPHNRSIVFTVESSLYTVCGHVMFKCLDILNHYQGTIEVEPIAFNTRVERMIPRWMKQAAQQQVIQQLVQDFYLASNTSCQGNLVQ